jgi:hypothetical protein
MVVPMVLLVVCGDVLLGLAIVGSLYAMSGQPPHRRIIVQRISLLAIAAFLVTDAITTPRHRWYNVAAAVFAVGAVLFDVLRKRRRQKVVSPEVRHPSAWH